MPSYEIVASPDEKVARKPPVRVRLEDYDGEVQLMVEVGAGAWAAVATLTRDGMLKRIRRSGSTAEKELQRLGFVLDGQGQIMFAE